jgi:chorismate mutase
MVKMNTVKEDIKKLRDEIDDLDKQLLKLLSQRFRLSVMIGEIKKENRLDVFDPEREKKLFTMLEKDCKDLGINKEFVFKIWKQIIDRSYSLQETFNNDEKI